MSYDNPPAVQDLPTAPQRGQPEQTFTQNANAFTSALAPWKADLVALADWMRSVGDTVQNDAHNAANSAKQAEAQEMAASGSADRAESARDAAIAAGKVYPSTADGLSATSDGEYFTVAGPTSYLTLYRNDNGQDQMIAVYPSQQTINDLEQSISDRFKNAPDPMLTGFIL